MKATSIRITEQTYDYVVYPMKGKDVLMDFLFYPKPNKSFWTLLGKITGKPLYRKRVDKVLANAREGAKKLAEEYGTEVEALVWNG